MNYPTIKVRMPRPTTDGAQVTMTTPDGTEHDISNYLTGLTVSASVGHITKVTLTMIANVDIETPATIAIQQMADHTEP